MRAVRVPVFAFLLALLMAGASFGDALVVVKAMRATTVCEIFVEAGVVRTELEIGVQSLPVFANLLPTEVHTRLGLEGKALKERLPIFFAEDWTVLADDEPLPGRLVAIEGRRRLPRDEISGEVTAAGEDAGEAVLFVVIEHPFEGRPKQLTIRPALLTRDARTSTDIGFVLWHGGIPVTDFRYLPGAVTVDLDWDDPWYSRFQHRNLRRTFAAPMMGFLYVEPFEVRREIVARPVDLQTWVDLGIDGDVIPAAAQGKLKEKVAAFLKDRCPVTVDGKAIEPVLDRIHFLRRTLRSTTVIEPPEDLPLSSALLGIIFAYPIEGLPQRATMTWDLWSERVPQVPATATDEAGGLPSILTPTDPVLTWQNFLKHPTSTGLVPVRDPPPPLTWPLPAFLLLLVVVGGALVYLRRGKPRPAAAFALIGCLLAGVLFVLPAARVPVPLGGAAAPSEAAAQEVIGAVLQNVYKAFERRGEDAVYEFLSHSVAGELLPKTYLEARRSLVLESQGGARVRVQAVEILSSETKARREGFSSRCRWVVSGAVGHWGHVHQRQNRYEADITFEPLDGRWKITGLDLVSEERL